MEVQLWFSHSLNVSVLDVFLRFVTGRCQCTLSKATIALCWKQRGWSLSAASFWTHWLGHESPRKRAKNPVQPMTAPSQLVNPWYWKKQGTVVVLHTFTTVVCSVTCCHSFYFSIYTGPVITHLFPPLSLEKVKHCEILCLVWKNFGPGDSLICNVPNTQNIVASFPFKVYSCDIAVLIIWSYRIWWGLPN